MQAERKHPPRLCQQGKASCAPREETVFKLSRETKTAVEAGGDPGACRCSDHS